MVNLLGDRRIRIYLALTWNFWLYTEDSNSVYLQNPKDQVIRVVELDKVNLPYYPSQPKVDKWSTCNFDTPNREPFFFCEELDRIILIQAMSRLIKSDNCKVSRIVVVNINYFRMCSTICDCKSSKSTSDKTMTLLLLMNSVLTLKLTR